MPTTLVITVQTDTPSGPITHLEVVLSPPMQLPEVENLALRIAAEASTHIHSARASLTPPPAYREPAAAGASGNTSGGGGGKG